MLCPGKLEIKHQLKTHVDLGMEQSREQEYCWLLPHTWERLMDINR